MGLFSNMASNYLSTQLPQSSKYLTNNSISSGANSGAINSVFTPYKITQNGITYTKMNPMLSTGTKEYETYKDSDGNYYLLNGTNFVKLQNKMSDIISENKKASYKINAADYGIAGATAIANAAGSGTGSGGVGSGGYYGGSGKGSDAYYEKLLDEYKQRLDALENPKVWTADELVKHYNMEDQYDYDRILKMYNDATDKYYADAIATQQAINKDAELSNSLYANSLLRNYLNSYKNAAPTAVGKGTRAANALSTLLNADLINEEAATNLNDVVNQYKENYKYELANNPTLARSRYNEIAKWLLTQGTNTNTAEVQDYINSLNAYDTAYSGIRNAQNNLASTAASAYQQRAQAALAQNAYDASNADSNVLMNAYKLKYGNTDNAWQKAYNNTRGDVSTVYTQSSSAK